LGSGIYSLLYNQTGSFNTASGYNSIGNNLTGNDNTGYGYNSLNGVITGSNNTGVGYETLFSAVSGTGNTTLGYESLLGNTTGNNNIAIGFQAGRSVLTTGSNNILIGANVDVDSSSGNQQLNIGDVIYGSGIYNGGSVTGTPVAGGKIGIGATTTPYARLSIAGDKGGIFPLLVISTSTSAFATSTALVVDQNGKVGIGFSNPTSALNVNGSVSIGTSTPYSRLTVWGADAASSTLAFNVVNGASTTVFAVFDGGNAQLSGTLTQSSDQRLKTNIISLDASSSLVAINELTPVTYNWLDPEKGGTRQYGFIAQQVQQVFPELVSTTSATALTPDGTLGLNYLGLIAPIVEAVKSLSTQLSSLEATVTGFADSFTSKKITASQELCIGATCVTETQLEGLLAGKPSVQISAPTPPTISGTTTPPSNDIQGSNPATIDIGSTYTDLGAIVTDNQGNSLGYKTFLNGTLVSNILIDMTQVATDTIDYVATDTWGNTSTSTRIVIVEATSTSTAQ
jgi:hypothetical protein